QKLKFFLDIALNPIGSLGLRERLERNKDTLTDTFHTVSSSAVTLILSPNGYRVVECFLNANIDDINVGLAESLSVEWNELKKVLKTVKGRYICETLLNRGLNAFAHKIIIITPKKWWFKGDIGPRALPILFKAISISECKIAQEFCSDKQTEEDLCDYPEGLYCVLKVKGKTMDQPGWKEELKRLMLLKARSTAGSEALEQVIVYGDFLSEQITEMIGGHRGSYDDSTTVSLIIRLIEVGSAKLKQHFFKLLCAPPGNPFICRIRSSFRFDDFKRACDSHFTFSQRNQLDSYLAATSREAMREDNVTTPTTGHSKKRRMEQQSIEPYQTVMKKSKEQVNNSSPSISISLTSIDRPTVSGQVISPSSNASPLIPSTVSMPTSGPVPQVSQFNLLPQPAVTPLLGVIVSLVPPPVEDTVSPFPPPLVDTVSHVSHSSLSDSSVKPSSSFKLAVQSVVKLDSPDGPTTATRPTRPSSNSTDNTPGSDNKRGYVDPGEDVISMAMSEKSCTIVSKLESGSVGLRQTIFACIQNGLMALMMDERGNEVVKWFIKNGSPLHKEIIERRVMMNVDNLVESGGYGIRIVKDVIEECIRPAKKEELNKKYGKAMMKALVAHSALMIDKTEKEDEDEILEIVSENVNKKEKTSPVPQEKVKERSGSVFMSKKSANRPGDSPIVKDPPRIISAIYDTELRNKFNEIVQKLTSNTVKVADLNTFVNSNVVVWFMKEQHTRRAFIDLINESILNWLETKRGLTFLKVLTLKFLLRTMLIPTVASVMHHLMGSEGEKVLDLMLSFKTAHLFITNCLKGDETSSFMRMLRSDMKTNDCAKIGMAMTRASDVLMRNFLVRIGGLVAETEKGRAFMALLASPLPVGWNWTELFKFLPPPDINRLPSITLSPSVSSNKDTVSPRVETTTPLPDKTVMDGATSLLPSSAKSNNTLDRSRPTILRRSSYRKDPSPQSSSLPIAPSHPSPIPSFPWILLPLFPQPRLPPPQPSISAILAERIVKETVDFIMSIVAEKYP
ncbi:hypothetical protein PENTCL1PPCAC_26581, partial [Pristionchus entomophagus]